MRQHYGLGAGLALSAAAATLMTAPSHSLAGQDTGLRWSDYVGHATRYPKRKPKPTGPTKKRAKVKAARKAAKANRK